MQKGTIKWFNNAKGWGFITSSESHSDVFLHFSAIVDKGYKKLKKGQSVLYSTALRSGKLYAVEVIPFDPESQCKNLKNKKIPAELNPVSIQE